MRPGQRAAIAAGALVGLLALTATAVGVALVATSEGAPTELARAISSHHEIPLSLARGIERTANDVGTRPEWLAALMDLETDGTFSPSVRNPTSRAVGLIQFTNKTARRLDTTTNELADMTALGQLTYVRRYLELVSSGNWPDDPRAMPLNTLQRLAFSVFWLPGRDAELTTLLPENLRAGNQVDQIGEYLSAVRARLLPGGFHA